MANILTVKDVVEQIVVKTATERENAIALHDYVRDNVKFGFNKYFDATPPDYTLACGHGHCNPKSRLMMTLLRTAGFECYQHFVVLPRDILNGVIPPTRFWMIPTEISHSYVEVQVEGNWCAIDSYIVDTPLLNGALTKLTSEERSLGYGVRTGSVNIWDGQSDAFSQYSQNMVIEDHGRVDDLQAFFHGKKYRHYFLGVRFNTVFQLMGEFGVAPMNTYIERIRRPSL